MPGYTCMWEFFVIPGRAEEFVRHYSSEGTWAALFRRAPGFVETALLRDRMNPRRFLTIDRWRSIEAFHAFKEAFAEDYAELDRRCADLTTEERFLGSYEEGGA